MKRIISILLLCLVAGCSTTRPAFLGNRIVCTVAKDEAFIVSKWGPIGISSTIDEKDKEVVCNDKKN